MSNHHGGDWLAIRISEDVLYRRQLPKAQFCLLTLSRVLVVRLLAETLLNRSKGGRIRLKCSK